MIKIDLLIYISRASTLKVKCIYIQHEHFTTLNINFMKFHTFLKVEINTHIISGRFRGRAFLSVFLYF